MWKKVALIFAVLFVVYAAAGFLALPALLKPHVQERLSLALNRQATIGDIDINPFTLSARVENLAISEEPGQAPVAALDELFVNVQARSLLKRALIVREVRLSSPSLVVTRTGEGTSNFSDLLERPETPDKEPDKKPFLFSVGNIQLSGGSIILNDTVTGARHQAADITMNIPFISNIDEFVESFVQPSLEAVVNGTSFSLAGQTKPFADSLETSVDIDLQNVSLPFYMGYLPRGLGIKVPSGTLSVEGKISYIQYRNRKPNIVARGSISVSDLSVLDDRDRQLIAMPGARVTLAPSRVTEKELSLSEVMLDSPSVSIRRGSSGLIEPASLFSGSGERPDTDGADAASPLLVTVKDFSLSKGTLEFTDASNSSPVRLLWSEVDLQAHGISTLPDTSGEVAFSSRVNGTGSVTATADVALNPLNVKARMGIGGLEIGWVQPYFSDKVQLAVTRGHLQAEGDLAARQLQDGAVGASFAGGARLVDFASVDRARAEDLVKWRTLVLDDIRAAVNPGSLAIGGVHINDLFTNIVVREDGSLNLVAALKSGDDRPERAAPAQTDPGDDHKPAFESISIGKVALENGEVSFLDRSVNPNFSSNLGELWGSVSGLSSEQDQRAVLDFSGKLNHGAPLKITGRVNPFTQGLFIDLHTAWKDIDLSAMTPYSGKYLGHTIEKGKLSLELKYLIDNRELDSSNDVLIDELTFGETVQSEHATSLPVRFAISLLKDPQGRIDLHLPIKGRTDDPEFSLTGIILKMLTNTITKAATSPFALLEAMYPGASDLGVIEFGPGLATLPDEAAEQIETLVKILTDKPSLKLDIQGFADPQTDRAGLADVVFEKKLKAEKLKSLVQEGTGAPALAEITISPEEYGLYLKKAYHASDFPKPRNFLGMPQSLEPEEMERLIRENITVTDSDLRLLAQSRAQGVKERIDAMRAVDPARVFLVEKDSLVPEDRPGAQRSRVEIRLR